MTARSTSRSRASCCCPCGLAPVVIVASGTRWGDATPCYASHHMMLVLLCVFKSMYLDRQRYTVFWPYTICRPNTKTKTSRTRGHTTHRHTRTDFFFRMYQLETRFARIKAKKAIQEADGKRQDERTKRTKKEQGRGTRRTKKRREKNEEMKK